MISLSSALLMLLYEKSLTFVCIRKIMEVFTKTDRKVLWSTLERLSHKGFIKKNKHKDGVHFSITAAGKKYLPKDPTFIPRPEKAWDGKWRLVVFDIPENQRKIRDIFTQRIKELGFGKMQNSCYISPHDASDKIIDLAKKHQIQNRVIVALVENLGIENLQDFSQNVWDLERLNQKYQEFIDEHRNSHKKLEYNAEVLKLWIKKTRFQYLSILHEDPVLPKELLPKNWLGYEAQDVWDQLEKILETY